MIEELLVYQIHLLALTGLAAIGILPMRAWSVLQATWCGRDASRARRAFRTIALTLGIACIAGELVLLRLVVHCLVGVQCYPAVADVWSHVAHLGALYVAFEVSASSLVRLANGCVAGGAG